MRYRSFDKRQQRELAEIYAQDSPAALADWVERNTGACGSPACTPHCECHTDEVWNSLTIEGMGKVSE